MQPTAPYRTEFRRCKRKITNEVWQINAALKIIVVVEIGATQSEREKDAHPNGAKQDCITLDSNAWCKHIIHSVRSVDHMQFWLGVVAFRSYYGAVTPLVGVVCVLPFSEEIFFSHLA